MTSERACFVPPRRAPLASTVCCRTLAVISMSSTGETSKSSLDAAGLHDGKSFDGFDGKRASPGFGFRNAAEAGMTLG